MVHIYEAINVKPLVKEFYEKSWRTIKETRRIFEEIGLELTKYGLKNVPLFFDRLVERRLNVHAGPVARAGCGLFRPSVVSLLKNKFTYLKTFGIGLSRSYRPDLYPANVYWNTLRNVSKSDLSNSLIILYEMGEATGSTIEGVINELEFFNIALSRVLFLIGAACVDQTIERLNLIAPNLSMVIGSRWKYIEEPGPTQFYLNQMFDGEWINLHPRDWGRCVSGMKDVTSVKMFIDWVRESVSISEDDEETLFKRWSSKINERKVG